jgi:hypothetical protein
MQMALQSLTFLPRRFYEPAMPCDIVVERGEAMNASCNSVIQKNGRFMQAIFRKIARDEHANAQHEAGQEAGDTY